jgi:hypothetical protein
MISFALEKIAIGFGIDRVLFVWRIFESSGSLLEGYSETLSYKKPFFSFPTLVAMEVLPGDGLFSVIL